MTIPDDEYDAMMDALTQSQRNRMLRRRVRITAEDEEPTSERPSKVKKHRIQRALRWLLKWTGLLLHLIGTVVLRVGDIMVREAGTWKID